MRTTLAIGTPRRSVGNVPARSRMASNRPKIRDQAVATPIAANDPAIEAGVSQRVTAVAWPQGRLARLGWIDAAVTAAVLLYFAAVLVAMAGEL